jgi:fumarate hydratase class I
MSDQIIKLTPPNIDEVVIRSLQKGDMVSITGVIVTGRDVAHKYLKDNFISNTPSELEKPVLDELKKYLEGGIIYHCGPVVIKDESGRYHFTAAGPTTSIREEPYEYDVIKLLGLRGVIGKGGMGQKTLKGCQEFGSVYLHAIGGAATYIASKVTEVHGVIKPEFGSPEAFWVISVKDLNCIVTMDSHGQSLHEQILQDSKKVQEGLNETFK